MSEKISLDSSGTNLKVEEWLSDQTSRCST